MYTGAVVVRVTGACGSATAATVMGTRQAAMTRAASLSLSQNMVFIAALAKEKPAVVAAMEAVNAGGRDRGGEGPAGADGACEAARHAGGDGCDRHRHAAAGEKRAKLRERAIDAFAEAASSLTPTAAPDLGQRFRQDQYRMREDVAIELGQ